ncbi:MAG: hypothetical protein JXQ72_12330 [Anaerolineae bacterium]|nr:hypothetical protein [Anaerolineae bacterium]
MTKRTSGPATKKERASLGTAAGVLLLVIVLFVQYGLGIDLLDTEGDTGGDVPADTQPVDTGGDTGGNAVSSDITAPEGDAVAIPGGIDGGWFQLYFTQPINSSNEEDFHGSPVEAALVKVITDATVSIDAALFELNSQPVTDALIAAKDRGVTVRVVVDGEFGIEKPETTVDQLELADIPVVSDGTRSGKMHNKFFVIDSTFVWTGSTNITHNGLYNNNNNAILIRSSRLAQNYALEFTELFAEDFGSRSPKTVPNPSVTVEGTQIETFFEAEGEVQDRLAELIMGAQTVRFLAFSFTDSLEYDDSGADRPLLDLILERTQAGQITLQGIVEASQRSFLKDLFCAGLDVRQDGNPDILHHKVFIFDDSIVATGSFNFSRSAASSNDENVLIIHNKTIAQAYLDEFARRWAEAQPAPLSELGC